MLHSVRSNRESGSLYFDGGATLLHPQIIPADEGDRGIKSALRLSHQFLFRRPLGAPRPVRRDPPSSTGTVRDFGFRRIAAQFRPRIRYRTAFLRTARSPWCARVADDEKALFPFQFGPRVRALLHSHEDGSLMMVAKIKHRRPWSTPLCRTRRMASAAHDIYSSQIRSPHEHL